MTDFIRTVGHTPADVFTRSANTTTYAAGQVVADSTTAATLRKFRITRDEGGFATVQAAILMVGANQTLKPDVQLWLFDTAPAIQNDAAAFAPSLAEMKTLIGVISFPVGSFVVANAASGASGNVMCNPQGLLIPMSGAKGDGNAYGVMVVRNAYVPTSGETWATRLICQD
jgi:hypothetical protein